MIVVIPPPVTATGTVMHLSTGEALDIMEVRTATPLEYESQKSIA